MPSVMAVLKEEISRLARKEAKATTGKLCKDTARLKRTMAEQKRRIANLERDNRRLLAAEEKRQKETPAVTPEETRRLRVTSQGVRSLRKKLGLSQAEFARLAGTSAQSVYIWESKRGTLKLRAATKAALLAVRGMGVREAKERLAAKAEGKRAGGTAAKRKK